MTRKGSLPFSAPGVWLIRSRFAKMKGRMNHEVPIFICGCFGILGLCQWIRRKRFFRVDADILLLGAYYLLVIAGYLLFEMVPINYRPVLIDGYLEASYPSSALRFLSVQDNPMRESFALLSL